MGNITMPTSLAVAGGGLCLLGGYLVGVVAGSDASSRSTAEVAGYDQARNELCLRGEAVEELPQAEDGILCGVWQHGTGSRSPREGESFRFVAMTNEDGGDGEQAVIIYGDVAR